VFDLVFFCVESWVLLVIKHHSQWVKDLENNVKYLETGHGLVLATTKIAFLGHLYLHAASQPQHRGRKGGLFGPFAVRIKFRHTKSWLWGLLQPTKRRSNCLLHCLTNIKFSPLILFIYEQELDWTLPMLRSFVHANYSDVESVLNVWELY
jgi:hypothetical protein